MFKGSLVALVTPMTADAALALDSLLHLVDWHIENGSDGLVILGSTGEAATLTEEERQLITHEVIRHVKKQASRKIPVIVGTGSNSTRTSIKWTREAMNAGADACLLVAPYYNRPTQEGLYLHFKAIAEAVAIPQILYNVPARTACDLLPKTVGALSALPNIIGIKEATGDVERVHEIRSLAPKEFQLFTGHDPNTNDFIAAGGDGVISVLANIAPGLMSDMCHAALTGDKAKAESIDQRLSPLYPALSLEANPIPVKWALHELGLIPSGIRLPLTYLSTMHHAALRKAMQGVGLLSL